MFLNARILSSSPASLFLIGLVFVAGMATGALLAGIRPLPAPSVSQALAPASAPAQASPAPAQTPRPATGLQELRFVAGGHTAEVLRVNDGDTFEARVHIWPGMQVTTKVRLRGIDAAELNARCAEEYRLAEAARDALTQMLAEGGVTISRIEVDKYGGRVLASAATRQTPDVSAALLQAGLVRAYEGGRRESWCGR